MQMPKPSHNRYLFHNLDEETYGKYFDLYSKAKRNGIRGVYIWASGMGLLGVCTDLVKGEIIQYGREKLAIAILGCAGWCLSPVVCVLSNATVIVKNAYRVHAICAFAFECAEDTSNLTFLPIDMFIFGQPVRSCQRNTMNLLGNWTLGTKD